MGWYEDFLNAVEGVRSEYAAEIQGRVAYQVQLDFNTEMLEEIADKTGHPNLATTCFVEIDSELNVEVYNDIAPIAGLFKSHSLFHPGNGGWSPVPYTHSVTKSEFWYNRFSGNDADELSGDYGGLDLWWLADNFWDGIYWKTNGWPRGGAEFLSAWSYSDVSAISVIKSYYSRYCSSNKVAQYANEIIAEMFS